MILYIIIAAFIIWVVAYIKNRKMILLLPYLFMIFVTPIYYILDSNFFVKIFGCGCVPITQANMFNIDFNANDLRVVVYSIIAMLSTIIGFFLAKKMEKRWIKILYILSILCINISLVYEICKIFMWM